VRDAKRQLTAPVAAAITQYGQIESQTTPRADVVVRRNKSIIADPAMAPQIVQMGHLQSADRAGTYI
jgi:hypothetical protein